MWSCLRLKRGAPVSAPFSLGPPQRSRFSCHFQPPLASRRFRQRRESGEAQAENHKESPASQETGWRSRQPKACCVREPRRSRRAPAEHRDGNTKQIHNQLSSRYTPKVKKKESTSVPISSSRATLIVQQDQYSFIIILRYLL